MDQSIKAMLLEQPAVSVNPLYHILCNCSYGYKTFCILNAAIELKIFDYLDTPQTSESLAETLKLNPDFSYSILAYLKELDLVEENNRLYQNSELSRCYLHSKAAFSQHNVVKNIHNGFKVWEKLSEIVKNGPISANESTFFADNLIHSLAEEALCGELQKVVGIIKKLPQFAKARSLLDLGGGHGLYSIALTAANSALRADVYDFPNVIEDTKKYIDRFCADRVDTLAGNYFKDTMHKSYDIILFSYSPGGKNPEMVSKICDWLNPEGILISKHCFYRRDEVSKSRLLDIEWNLLSFEGVAKDNKIYSFCGDYSLESYLELLKKMFVIQDIVHAPDFSGQQLDKIGDALDSILIIAKKK